MTKSFKDAVSGIRTAVLGKEVREDIAQGMEYVEQFASWCCTIKVDIENSKSQYIEKDKQEATKDGSESTKI